MKKTVFTKVLAFIFFISICFSNQIMAKAEGTLIVKHTRYDELYSTRFDGLINATINGNCGVINTTEKAIVPFTHNRMRPINREGYTVAYKGPYSLSSDKGWDPRNETSFLYDKTGRKLFESRTQYLEACTEGIMLIWENIKKTGDNEYPIWNHTAIYKTIDGKEIRRFNNVERSYWFSDGYAIVTLAPSDEESNYETIVIDKNGKTVLDSSSMYDIIVAKSAYSNGYFMYNVVPKDSMNIMDAKGNSAGGHPGEFCYSSGKDGMNILNIGTLAVLCDNYSNYGKEGLMYLVDLAKDFNILSKGYKEILLNYDEKYFLVSPDGQKYGFLSRDGKTEKMYKDAGEFRNNKAIVLDNNGKAYTIDDNFKKISNEISGYDAVTTLGYNLYSVKKDGKWFLAMSVDDVYIPPQTSTPNNETATPTTQKVTPKNETPMPTTANTKVIWPVPNIYSISSPWGMREYSQAFEFHTGIDIDGRNGDGVLAVMDGVIEKTETTKNDGIKIIIKHTNIYFNGDYYRTLYHHLSKCIVQNGQEVKAGTKIGEIGKGHLHFSLYKGIVKYPKGNGGTSYTTNMINPLEIYNSKDKRNGETNRNPFFIKVNNKYIFNTRFDFEFKNVDKYWYGVGENKDWKE